MDSIVCFISLIVTRLFNPKHKRVSIDIAFAILTRSCKLQHNMVSKEFVSVVANRTSNLRIIYLP